MRNKFRKLKLLLGREVAVLFALFFTASILLFVSELCFPFGIRLFLIKIGLSENDKVRFLDSLNDLTLLQVVVFISFISIFRGCFQWVISYVQGAISEEFKYRIRTKLVQTIYKEFSSNSSKAHSIFGEYSNNAAMFLSLSGSTVSNLVIAALLLGAMYKVESILTLFVLSGATLLGVLFYSLSAIMRKQGVENQKYWNNTSHRLSMSLKNLPLVKIYGMEEKEKRVGQFHLKLLKENMIRAFKLSATLQSVPQVVGMSLIFFIIVKGDFPKKVNPGTLVAYIFLTFRFFTYSSNATQTASQALVRFHFFKDLYSWWFEKKSHVEVPYGPHRKLVQRSTKINLNLNKEMYAWKVRDLSFSYVDGRATAIENLNFDIAAGSFCAITGESGSGKTSLLFLLLGLLNGDSGSVEMKYHNNTHLISTLDNSFLSRIGYVGPESFLIEGTILENLQYGNDTKIEQKNILEAINRSDCGFIFETSGGLEHRISEQGMGLSAGQKQRIALARALLRSPKALILDEATANVDEETEARLSNTFKSLKGIMTIIMITHKKELVKIADSQLHLSVSNPMNTITKKLA